MKRARTSSILVAPILGVTLLVSGCRVVGPIKEAQKVSMNPCKLIGLPKAQAVMGGPMYQQLVIAYSQESLPTFDECVYQFQASHEGPHITVSVAEETRKSTQDARLGDYDWDSGTWKTTNESAKPLKRLGREARYRYTTYESWGILDLVVITRKGAKLRLKVRLPNKDVGDLLPKARSLAGPAVAKMEDAFPGTETPNRLAPPPMACSAVGLGALIDTYMSFWTPPPGKSIQLSEWVRTGGPNKAGAGPVGGGWICDADLEPHIYGGDGEVFHPHAAWWISKISPPMKPSPESEPVQDLGLAAFSRVGRGWWYEESAVILSVFTQSGQHFEVEVYLDQVEESVARKVARAVAEKILSSIS